MKATVTQYAKTLFELTDKKSEQEISHVVKKFAEVLRNDGQVKNAKNIIEKFSQLYNEKHGIIEATVVTREKLDDLEKIEKFVKEKYEAKEVILKNIIDEDIKGGIVIKVGDEILDGSVSAQLKRLKKALSN
jgi:F-type H+-transporting ATPase subunit delta